MNGNDPAFERLADDREERAYKRGFDAGIAYQKKADPPPMAKALKKELELLRSAARAVIWAHTPPVVHPPIRAEALEQLKAALGDKP